MQEAVGLCFAKVWEEEYTTAEANQEVIRGSIRSPNSLHGSARAHVPGTPYPSLAPHCFDPSLTNMGWYLH